MTAKRKRAVSQLTPTPMSLALGRVLDALDNEIRFAHGISVAVAGLDMPGDCNRSGVAELVDVHIERLTFLRDGLETEREAARKAVSK